MNAITYLNELKPALPMSREKPCTLASQSELRRWLASGSVLFNGERCTWDEEIDFPVFSLVFFPSSKNRTTVV